MLTLLLADAELERVPSALAGHPQVVQAARRFGVRPSEMLLDSSLHHASMRNLPDGERRGRPDLVHLFLLTALESIPNKLGQLRVAVHTRHDELLRVNPRTRLIRNYNRFCGLMQQLLAEGVVGGEDAWLRSERERPLASILEEFRPQRTIVLDPGGTPASPSSIFGEADQSREVLCVIGGFPSGDYRSPLPPASERMSIFAKPLTVWTVAAEVLAHYPRPAGANATR